MIGSTTCLIYQDIKNQVLGIPEALMAASQQQHKERGDLKQTRKVSGG